MLVPFAANAQQRGRSEMSLIRDAEIEDTIRLYSQPVFQAAGLGNVDVQVFIINNPSINAFVAGGRYMFINTGTLMQAEQPEQVIGVLAHETGHLVGGHVYRLRERLREAQLIAIISTLLSAAAAAGTRDSEAMGGAIAGQQTAQNYLFSYVRSQERAADRYAVEIMDRIGVSSEGMLDFFALLRGQEALISSRQDPYLRTHPLTQDRIEFFRQHVQNSPHTGNRVSEQLQRRHARMRGKLIGFLQSPRRVLERYEGQEDTLEARYALAVAYHRRGELPRALEYIDGLIAENPRDPYFVELRGQILFESGRIDDAVASYREAVALHPNSPLIRAALGHALVEQNTEQATDEAIPHLRQALRQDPFIAEGWRLLAVAYGRQGDIGNSSLALAEYYLLLRDSEALRRSVARAEENLQEGSPSWQRLQDIKAVLQQANGRDDG